MKKLFVIIIATLGVTLGACSTATTTPKAASSNSGSTGSTGNTGSTTASLYSWWQSVQTAANAIAADGGSIQTDANNQDLNAVGTDCQSLLSDVQSAQSDPPVPNSLMEINWSTALSDYEAGAKDCIDGVDNYDVTKIRQATTELDNGTQQINELTNAVKQATGQ